MGKWSDHERAHALDLLRDGQNLPQVVTATGIPKSTLAGWARDEGLDLAAQSDAKTRQAVAAARAKWAERRETLADRIGEGTELALDQAITFLREGRPRDAKDAATTLGILVDKAQLLTGAATSRSDHLGLQAQVLEQARTQAPHLRAVG